MLCNIINIMYSVIYFYSMLNIMRDFESGKSFKIINKWYFDLK